MSVIESDVIVEMEGTQVTTEITTLGMKPKTWVIQEKVSEHAYFWLKEDAELDCPPPYAAGKFRCYDKADPARKLAFMRIYRQLPAAGTEFASLSTRARQAISEAPSFVELDVFKTLKEQGFPEVPDLLGYHTGQQPDDALVPGGFTTTLVWETVPGSVLSEEAFWSYGRAERDWIRAKFRSLFGRLRGYGFFPVPGVSGIQKLIYDRKTGNLKIAGFVDVDEDGPTEFEELDFAHFNLVKLPDRGDEWESHPSTWEY